MLQSGDRETEILLGNKQLLGIFFVVAALLGIAFTGGYMIGRGANPKKAVPPSAAANGKSSDLNSTGIPGGETHSVPPDDSSAPTLESGAGHNPKSSRDLLGSRKAGKTNLSGGDKPSVSASARADSFVPQNGQEFLQVTAVPHDHALAIAAVLRKKGFHAHAVPKPGQANLYRVIVGPIHDAGELSSTRDSLRRTGFNQVIVQHYQE